MKFTSLGRTGLKVSRICLGTMNFGNATDEKESFAIMDRALESGINFFDTANRYGSYVGRTEEIIGKWLTQGGRRREQIVLATKLFGPMGPGANDEDLSAYHIRMACQDSLQRLQTDHIDLYQMHHISRGRPHPKSQLEYLNGDLSNLVYPPHIKPGVPWEEIWQQMGQLIQAGKILYVGSSNFAAWNIVQANERAAARHFLGLVSEQSLYNLSKRMLELEMIPACREYGVGLLPWSPLGGGLLAGALEKATQGRRANLQLSEEKKAQVQAYEDFCKELGEAPATVALAWLLHNPVVTAPIIGPRTLDQLESAVRALDLTLSEDVLVKLDEIWPGPGNQAPEAYAW
ncbi:aldo/keto reductase [candidate division KSB3 bacterium]|uniref:Aldo/keto reductase n=1 Tax=candidate division KSB3 bacterium TaxID=2044937 RepID=A0A2G6KHP1_9BACT|nr:MAG: aldo/keto reductase [candidate division KSB3 bacterium]